MTKKLSLKQFQSISLGGGCHTNRNDGVCALEAAAWLAGEPHSDHPECVCPVIASFLRSWNDGLPTNEDRDRLIRPRLVAQRTGPVPHLRRNRARMKEDQITRIAAMPILETIEWHPVAHTLPDADLTVLGWRDEWDEVCFCFLDGELWRTAEGPEELSDLRWHEIYDDARSRNVSTARHLADQYLPPTYWAEIKGPI